MPASPAPCDLSVNTALDLNTGRVGETVFRMLAMQQILPRHGHLEARGQGPAEPGVELEIGGNLADEAAAVDNERIHPAKRSVPIQLVRQMHGRSNRKAMRWVCGFTPRIVEVGLPGTNVQPLMEIVVAGMDRPGLEQLRVRGDFDTFGVARDAI